ncbi:hypothetical protein SEVIR_2G233100v4 [Setaria viridis]|uniref:Uncharacterized protein n=3 Tax=Setaria TaxID=4554 RepID=A0A368Q1U3_SETIT|nr:uncharacterized protein LOC101772358 [Setaria italica]XP_034582388.1 uncharacterized protein LOC117845449 [Setaria viridis]RCV11889.1 hypothetical protein SETIT_2G223000v2 [Setaria italica]TKW33405.1 hypothetical protein SEVIR_2G233100v2 [Setaria viridis]
MGNSYSGGGSSSSSVAALEVPLHLCFFLLVLLLFLGFSWYTSYESAAESFANQARILLMASPFALLLAVRLLSSVAPGEGGAARGVGDLLAVPMPERDSIHRAGGSPWGVGLLLLLLLVMVSYQSNFREKWFPLASR